MSNSSAHSAIRLRGVRQNNLKGFDLDLPLNQLIVVTGLSGSGKSSLAFDTLFAEGQRRYIETFSPYARQFFDRMDKPRADSIEGIPPAIAIEQRNAVRTTRSTVGTMTEICDHLKVLWPALAQLHCRNCGQRVRKDPPQRIWDTIREAASGNDLVIAFDLPLSEKLSLAESLGLIAKQGYQRLLFDGRLIRVEEFANQSATKPQPLTHLTVVQDRVRADTANRSRFIEACEQAYHFGKGKLAVLELGKEGSVSRAHLFSNRLHCARCDIDYREPSPPMFSFNHPVGACPACRGFGRVISIDYNLVIPDRSRTLAQGVVKPWLTGTGAESQSDLLRMCRAVEIPTDVPFDQLPKKYQDRVIEGDPEYGKDEEHEWPRAWYGVKGYFRWLESKAYKMHIRVLLSRYRAYTPCPDCGGKRFQPDTLLYRIASFGDSSSQPSKPGLTLADFYLLPIRDAAVFLEKLAAHHKFASHDPLGLVLQEVRSRLNYLNAVGLGYLTLDRPTRSLSGGETERVNLTTCLGTRLVNTLFVLDEPSVGLHARDTARLVRIVQQLRDAGNTVVVVEHEAAVMRAADQIIDLGPGHGASGGNLVFQGPFDAILKAKDSLTGEHLAGKVATEPPPRRPVDARHPDPDRAWTLNDRSQPLQAATPAPDKLIVSHATCHNLRDLRVEIPLGRLVCLTGVSGSGKTTLVRDILMPLLKDRFQTSATAKASARLTAEPQSDQENDAAESTLPGARVDGGQSLENVVLVDQSALGKTPRSNPAVYIGAFDDIREVFAQSATARQRGYGSSAFSFNSRMGQCEKCRGAGFEKIEMQFLSDIFIRCPECDGRRYQPHILEIRISPAESESTNAPRWSIGDVLEATVEEAIRFFAGFPNSRPAQRAAARLKLLEEVGLGYLKLGQPINTLSGGESQRLKLVAHLADSSLANSVPATQQPRNGSKNRTAKSGLRSSPVLPLLGVRADFRSTNHVAGQGAPAIRKSTLFLFDEPTTGLHFEDIRILVRAFQRLVDAGHSLLVIEHNLDLICAADWVIDLGPEAGDEGGQIMVQGTPEEVAMCPESHTGKALREAVVSRGQNRTGRSRSAVGADVRRPKDDPESSRAR
jgi:excinuclease ABC subunit A